MHGKHVQKRSRALAPMRVKNERKCEDDMGSLNKVMLVGRLGKDPEIRHTAAGMAVCAMSIATDSKWTNKAGEKQEKTEWHRVKAWAKLGEVCGQYLA